MYIISLSIIIIIILIPRIKDLIMKALQESPTSKYNTIKDLELSRAASSSLDLVQGFPELTFSEGIYSPILKSPPYRHAYFYTLEPSLRAKIPQDIIDIMTFEDVRSLFEGYRNEVRIRVSGEFPDDNSVGWEC